MKTKPLTTFTLLAAFAATSSFAFAQDTVVEATKTETKTTVEVKPASEEAAAPAIAAGTLTAKIADGVTFSVLTQALKAAGLDVTLADPQGVFTIFAPTDAAFDKLPAGTLGQLLLPENKEKLRSLLLYHVVPGKVMAADLKDGDVTTMNAEKIEIDVDKDEIKVEDTKIFSADVAASNGVMHSIGEVLVPESLDGFAGLED